METNEVIEQLRQEVERLDTENERLKAEAERRDEATRQELANAEASKDELRQSYREQIQAQLERWQAEVTRRQDRLDEILATDQGRAWTEVTHLTRQVEAWKAQAERAEERTTKAEADKAEALASVAGSDNIHPEDPRVLHIWEKAHRIATSAGFCSEYDRIAEALGVPDLEQDYSGTAEVRFRGTVNVPISGRASRREIADGDVSPDIDTSEVIENLDTYDIDWEIEGYEIEPD